MQSQNILSGLYCLRCQEKHTLLHVSKTCASPTTETNEKSPETASSGSNKESAGSTISANVAALAASSSRSVLLATAQSLEMKTATDHRTDSLGYRI